MLVLGLGTRWIGVGGVLVCKGVGRLSILPGLQVGVCVVAEAGFQVRYVCLCVVLGVVFGIMRFRYYSAVRDMDAFGCSIGILDLSVVWRAMLGC